MNFLNRNTWLLSAALPSVVAVGCSGIEISRVEDPTAEALISTVAAAIETPTATIPAPSSTPPRPTATPATGVPTATVPTVTVDPTPTQTPPSPSVSAPDTSGSAPLTVQFNVSDAPNIDSVSWDFGDGTVSAELSPEHTFILAGTHTVQLTVTDLNGQQIFAQSTTVDVSPGPVAPLAISPEDPTVAVLSTVQFSATAEDQFGNPVELAPQWSLNGIDGEINPNGTFTAAAAAGTFNDAIVVSSGGVSSSITLTIDPGPVATLELDQTEIDLVVQESVTIDVTARDEFGNEIANPTIAWNVVGDAGSVDLDGKFTAGTRAGEFADGIVATSAPATTHASVTIRPGELSIVELSPRSAIVPERARMIFSARAQDAFSNEIAGIAIEWSADGGSITPNGVFAAGNDGGEFGVTAIATIDGLEIRNTATANVPPYWASVGDLRGPRSSHTATHLPDGDVLIIGETLFAERYDAQTQKFVLTQGEKCGHGRRATATLLPDGTVLVVGGQDDPKCAEIYDPVSDHFTRVADMNEDHWEHSATLMNDGTVLIAGGNMRLGDEVTTQAVAEIYDPAARGFQLTGELNDPRLAHAASLLRSGDVLIAAGEDIEREFKGDIVNLECVQSVERYDPKLGVFVRVGNLEHNWCVSRSVTLDDGRVLIISANGRGELYDPTSGRIEATGVMTQQRYEPTVSVLPSGMVLITGGNGRALTTSELYDPVTGRFDSLSTLTDERAYAAAASLADGTVLVTGGYNGSAHSQTAEIYFPASIELENPQVSFTTNATSGPAPHAVTFTNTSLGAFTSVEWDFSDGAASAEVSPEHTYTVAGDYDVTLTMTGPGGTDTVVMENLITVEPGPITSITIEPFDIDVAMGESVQITATASDEFGNEVPDAEVSWSVASAAGSINSTGLFTGGGRVGVFAGALTIDFMRDGIVSRANHDITINDGLIHLWTGDGTANDSAGDNHGTLMNGAEYAPGLFGQAFRFDGDNDYIALTNQPELADAYSISVWIDLNNPTFGEGQAIFTSDSLFLVKVHSAEANPFEFGTPTSITQSDTAANPDWTHVAATWDGAINRIYIDGVLDSKEIGGSNIPSGIPTQIGRGDPLTNKVSGAYFSGLMDELAIYGRMLTASEIAAMYEVGRILKPPPGLVHRWSGDGHANDAVGGNHGTPVNGASFAPGLFGDAFSLDGNNDYVLLDRQPEVSGDFTISAWVKQDEARLTDCNSVFSSESIGLMTDCFMELRGFQLISSANVVHSVPSATTDWTHVVGTWDGTTNRIYVDGVLDSDATANGPGELFNLSPQIGRGEPKADELYPFDGLIDELLIFNRALSELEIFHLYEVGNAVKPPSGLVNHWTADGHSNDVVGTNDGTRQNGASFAEGKVGTAFRLDGNNDHVLLQEPPDFSEGFTMSAWIKLDGRSSETQALFNDNLIIWRVEDRTRSVSLFVSLEGSSHDGGVLTGTSVAADEWIHVVGSWDGSTLRAYVNGREEATLPRSGILNSDAQFAQIGRGAPGTPTAFPFSGLIDEFRIYNRALSAEDVQKVIELDGGLP